VVLAGGDVVGIDISTGMLQVAQARQLAQLAVADMMALPFADASFDAVLAVHVLHHASDWRLAMRECARACAVVAGLLRA
jgi:ubiquinone/menaquinone biosynthesis C-methylase UbiE